MLTRFVHIGDVHLQAGHPRNADRLQALRQIVREGLALEQLGAWLIPGDLFETRSTAQDRNDLAAILRDMQLAAPVCLVRGNHDAPGDIDIFGLLRGPWPVYVWNRPCVQVIPLATGEKAAIAAIPYPDKHGLVTAGVQPSDVSQTALELLDIIFMQLAGELESWRASGAIPIGLGHFNVRGAIASARQPQIGREQEIDRASLARLGVVYFALSHIHKAQEVGEGVYAGSIAAMDYGETEAKSYVVVETDGGCYTDWNRRSIATPPMFHIDGTFFGGAFHFEHDEWMCQNCHGDGEDATARESEGVCLVCGGTGKRRWDGCDVRVRYTYHASERALVNEGEIRDEFPGVLRLKIEGVAIPDRDLRAPEVAAAKTLPEKLAAYRKEEALPPAIAEKLALLETQPADQVLADVAARLKVIEQPEEVTVAA